MYKFERIVDLDTEKTFLKISQKLKEIGFALLSYVDVKEIIKNKFGDDFPVYYILDVCKPEAARELIGRNHDFGLYLPCKIVIEGDGKRSKIKMLLISELAQKYIDEDPGRPRFYENELRMALESI